MAAMRRTLVLGCLTTTLLSVVMYGIPAHADDPVTTACQSLDNALNPAIESVGSAMSQLGLATPSTNLVCGLADLRWSGQPKLVTPAPHEGGNPYGCYGQTDNPHHSTHQPGRANVVARTKCAVSVPYIAVYTWLYYWNGAEWVLKSADYKVKYGTDKAEISVSSPCVNPGSEESWDGVSYHEVRDSSAVYYAYTENENTFVCGSA